MRQHRPRRRAANQDKNRSALWHGDLDSLTESLRVVGSLGTQDDPRLGIARARRESVFLRTIQTALLWPGG